MRQADAVRGAEPESPAAKIVSGNDFDLLRLEAVLGRGFLIANALDSLLFGGDPHDPATYAGVSLVLALVTSAALVPALRPSHVEPVKTLCRG